LGYEFYVSGVSGRSSVWQSELDNQLRQRKTFLVHTANGDVSLETFHVGIPVCGRFVRWSAPSIVSLVYGDDYPGNWICRRVEYWRKWCSDMGFNDPEHVRSSVTSMRQAAMKAQRCLEEGELANVNESFSFSSEALILVAVWFGSSPRLKHPFGIDVCERASRFLDGLIGTFLTHDIAKIPLVGSRGVVELLIATNGKLSVGAGSRADRSSLGAAIGNGLVRIGDACMALGRNARGSIGRLKQLSIVALGEIAKRFAADVDWKMDDDFVFLNTVDREVTFCQRSGSSRLRRIPLSFKQAVTALVVKDPTLKSETQFLAAAGLQQRRAEKVHRVRKRLFKRSRMPNPSSAVKWVQDKMLAYQAGAWRDFEASSDFFFSVDAVQASGKDWWLFAVGCPMKQLHAWAPPQVFALEVKY
jgi:hypothetical protein